MKDENKYQSENQVDIVLSEDFSGNEMSLTMVEGMIRERCKLIEKSLDPPTDMEELTKRFLNLGRFVSHESSTFPDSSLLLEWKNAFFGKLSPVQDSPYMLSNLDADLQHIYAVADKARKTLLTHYFSKLSSLPSDLGLSNILNTPSDTIFEAESMSYLYKIKSITASVDLIWREFKTIRIMQLQIPTWAPIKFMKEDELIQFSIQMKNLLEYAKVDSYIIANIFVEHSLYPNLLNDLYGTPIRRFINSCSFTNSLYRGLLIELSSWIESFNSLGQSVIKVIDLLDNETVVLIKQGLSNIVSEKCNFSVNFLEPVAKISTNVTSNTNNEKVLNCVLEWIDLYMHWAEIILRDNLSDLSSSIVLVLALECQKMLQKINDYIKFPFVSIPKLSLSLSSLLYLKSKFQNTRVFSKLIGNSDSLESSCGNLINQLYSSSIFQLYNVCDTYFLSGFSELKWQQQRDKLFEASSPTSPIVSVHLYLLKFLANETSFLSPKFCLYVLSRGVPLVFSKIWQLYSSLSPSRARMQQFRVDLGYIISSLYRWKNIFSKSLMSDKVDSLSTNINMDLENFVSFLSKQIIQFTLLLLYHQTSSEELVSHLEILIPKESAEFESENFLNNIQSFDSRLDFELKNLFQNSELVPLSVKEDFKMIESCFAEQFLSWFPETMFITFNPLLLVQRSKELAHSMTVFSLDSILSFKLINECVLKTRLWEKYLSISSSVSIFSNRADLRENDYPVFTEEQALFSVKIKKLLTSLT